MEKTLTSIYLDPSELPSEVNKVNSNLPNEKNKTSVLPCEASKLNSNFPNTANETSK